MPPAEFRKDWKLSSIEGFLFPATYEFTKLTSSAKARERPARAFRRNWRRVNLRYARSKNLTPYDVLIIASMIEKETVAPEERKLVAAVIYNRLRNRMPLGIDATIRYGRNVPGTEPLKQSDIESDNPYNTRRASACRRRRSRTRAWRRCAPPPARRGRLPLLRAEAGRRRITSSPRASPSSARSRSSTATAAARRRTVSGRSATRSAVDWPPGSSAAIGTTTLVGLTSLAGKAVALARDAQRRVRRPRAWTGRTSSFPRLPPDSADAVRGLSALGFAGANVTTPHKTAVTALRDDAPSVNTLVVRDGRIEGWTTDAAILTGSPGSPVVIGDGGVATAFMRRCPRTAVRARGTLAA